MAIKNITPRGYVISNYSLRGTNYLYSPKLNRAYFFMKLQTNLQVGF